MSIYEYDGIQPRVDPGAWVAPDANVIGRVQLDNNCSVWFGATLRGDNEAILIGAGTNIQENCVLHTDIGFPLTAGKNCTIGHSAILHGCIIEDGSLIGMGATILNGAKIGKGCLIGAGALVTEGTVIPDGSLVVGTPAKIIRELNEDAIAKLLDSATGYQEKSKKFAATMREIHAGNLPWQ